MSDKLCNMCGETTNADLTGESGGSEDGLIDAKVHGGYYSPALRDMSMYKFSFCEYCLDHIFQQCINPPKAWEYCFIDYQPIEEQLKDEKYKRGELYPYHEKVLEEKKRRDKLRANAKPYKSTSKEMLDYEKSWHSFGNREIAPTKDYQNKMKALRDETVRLFHLLTEEEKQELIYERSSYPFTEQVPPEQWWDDSIPSDEEIVSQETHDAYEKLCNICDMDDAFSGSPEYEQKNKEMKKVFKEFFDSMSDEAKKVSQGLYNVVFEVRDPIWDAVWEKMEEELPKDKIVMLSPRPEYPEE